MTVSIRQNNGWLPYDTAVEWIGGDNVKGGTYIKTGIMLDECAIVKVAFMMPSNVSYNYDNSYLVSGFNGDQDFTVHYLQNTRFRPWVYKKEVASLFIANNVMHVATFTSTQTTVDEMTPMRYNYPKLSVTNHEVMLFHNAKNCVGRIGSVELRDANDNILFDAIAVRFTNKQFRPEGAMYDRVSKTLLKNQGTGAFVIGPDKLQ